MRPENIEFNGELIGKKVRDTLIKYVRSSRGHVCRKYDAWGFQVPVIFECRESGVERVIVIDTDTDIAYITKVVHIIEDGTIDTLNPADGEQIFLPRAEWEQVEEWSKQ